MFKDTTITARQKIREARILLACFIVSYLVNIIGIIIYQAPARELYSQLHVVLILTFFLYFLTWFFRILYYLVKWLFVRARKVER